MQELDKPISRNEIRLAIRDLKNNKSPGANNTPAEAFKAMNASNRAHVHEIIKGFWDGTHDYPDWHTGTGTPIPKTTRPDDPNQFRIINLMDVCSKIFSRILTARTYKILEKHGTKNQFGATRNVGCQDGNFTLKTLVHLRRQHNQETYVVFADLVKAFDTSNHELIINILKKFGAPTKFCNTIERLYSNLSVSLKIGKESAVIPQTIGVRQGDNLSPVIFLLLMTAFAEILEAKWTIAKIDKIQFNHCNLDTNSLSTGRLTGHNTKRTNRTSSCATAVTHMLYLDDGSFPFNTREDMIAGCEIINDTFNELGLEMHTGKGDKKSKTELIFFPTASFFNKTAHPTALPPTPSPTPTASITSDPSADTTDDNGGQITKTNRQRKLTFSTMTQKQRETLYHNSPKTNRVHLNDGSSFIDFTAHFKYLGTYIYILRSNGRLRHQQPHNQSKSSNGRPKPFLEQPVCRSKSQAPHLPGHSSKPTSMGMRNMGITTIPHQPTQRILAPKHQAHPKNKNGRSERRPHNERKDTENFLQHT